MSYVLDSRHKETLNQPVIMVGDDDNLYHVKFNPKNNTKIGINELTCSLIAQHLELPVFEPIIASVPDYIINNDARIRNTCGGKHFATRFIKPFETVNVFKNQGKEIKADLIGNIRMVPDFIIFDKYIENFDRHDNNICLLPNENLLHKFDYYLFDHDLAFQRTSIQDMTRLRDICKRLEYMSFIVSHITQLSMFNKITSKIESLKQNIPDIIAAIPTEWRNNQTKYIINMEILLTKFSKQIATDHILQNKNLLPQLMIK